MAPRVLNIIGVLPNYLRCYLRTQIIITYILFTIYLLRKNQLTLYLYPKFNHNTHELVYMRIEIN